MPRERAPVSAQARNTSRNRSAWTVRRNGADVHGIGNQAILGRNCLGLICSVQCPGSVVIKTFDAIRELRDAGVVVAGGFHSPMEKECLEFLLRGEQEVIVVRAKGLGQPRLPHPWRTAIDAARLLVLTPFGENVRRTTKALAQARNEFIVTHAAAVLIPHASPGGQAEATARTVLDRGKPLITFEDEENQSLLQWGATRFSIAATLRMVQDDWPSN
ncbi:MAG: hypothetical protein K1X57_22600 [Gemmataceae bacterium]|nr:hypothetical protein [Gemmataceae bacterium]